MNIAKIKDILQQHKDELRKKYDVAEIGIFGSYARGEPKENSDIDILVEFLASSKMSLLEFIGLEIYLGELLGAKVDLVEKKALKQRIGKRILAELVRL